MRKGKNIPKSESNKIGDFHFKQNSTLGCVCKCIPHITELYPIICFGPVQNLSNKFNLKKIVCLFGWYTTTSNSVRYKVMIGIKKFDMHAKFCVHFLIDFIDTLFWVCYIILNVFSKTLKCVGLSRTFCYYI